MNYRIRSTGGTVWFSPKLSVSYRPRSSLSALARQYFHYGRWRRVIGQRRDGGVRGVGRVSHERNPFLAVCRSERAISWR